MPKILIVDDEALVTRSIKRLLNKKGYEVFMAKNGMEAIEEVKKEEFDLIISDVRMPGIDGVEMIKNIRNYLKDSNKKHIPEILISGYADENKYEEAVNLGVKEYLFKPFDTRIFLEAVEKILR